jgi:hypothetical protein
MLCDIKGHCRKNLFFQLDPSKKVRNGHILLVVSHFFICQNVCDFWRGGVQT